MFLDCELCLELCLELWIELDALAACFLLVVICCLLILALGFFCLASAWPLPGGWSGSASAASARAVAGPPRTAGPTPSLQCDVPAAKAHGTSSGSRAAAAPQRRHRTHVDGGRGEGIGERPAAPAVQTAQAAQTAPALVPVPVPAPVPAPAPAPHTTA